jgi:NADH:ubiquinone oxidoreductase subunit 5 (subunit L)/multisubunit Na+/H+ antiporter MnhA subunit
VIVHRISISHRKIRKLQQLIKKNMCLLLLIFLLAAFLLVIYKFNDFWAASRQKSIGKVSFDNKKSKPNTGLSHELFAAEQS